MPKKKFVDAVLKSYDTIGGINHLDGKNLPSRQSIHHILDLLKQILFPGYFESLKLTHENLPYVTGQKILNVIELLQKEASKSLNWHSGEDSRMEAKTITYELIDYIPKLRETLKDDMTAIFKGDPAAKSEPEIILAYPGFQAVTVYRIAHFLYNKGVPLIPRLMSEIVHSETGIDIHPGAKIGRHFCIDHGTGVVIGETAVLGNNVKLYQGVTIGALSVPDRDKITAKRHPTLKDNVTVYARTTILGGETVIGKNSVIGGNVWITKSVPDNSKVFFSPKYELSTKNTGK